MSRVLKYAFHVQGAKGLESFMPGDVLPDEFEVGDHLFVAEADEVAKPPLKGKGSSREAWVTYAKSKGVLVDEGVSVSEIADALEELDAEQAQED